VKIPTEWTMTERIDMATTLLKCIQDDLIANRYFLLRLPTIQLALDVLHLDPLALNEARPTFVRVLSDYGVPWT
jgi:hypothetical protein